MKFLLAAVGSKYIHSNLAVRSLGAYAAENGLGSMVETVEYTINQNTGDILADIYRRRPDAVGFSCYIWNIRTVRQLAADLNRLLPEAELWLGGPEASYDGEGLLRALPFVRGVMMGEGEETFLRLLRFYGRRENSREEETEAGLAQIPGLLYRSGRSEDEKEGGSGGLRRTKEQSCLDLSALPFVYEHREEGEEHKILYYESSRGCPFSCSYCLSSLEKKLRFRDWRLVQRELDIFLARRVPQVKFVDRTFNVDRAHTKRIWSYLAGHDNGVTNFHFEISADLLDEEELSILAGMRPGLVQLEIGVQSTNPDTLRAIRRNTNLERLAENVRRIVAGENVHVHLDLIAGLPWEDYESFGRSFDWVYALRPHQLQLGFLKVLAGSAIHEQAQEYSLIWGSEPPYEVLGTAWLSYEDICRLKQIEKVFDIYYNSGQFPTTIERLAGYFSSPFALYESLASYYEERRLFDRQLGRRERFEVLWEFIERSPGKFQQSEVAWRELLVYDYYLRENAKVRPDFAPDADRYRQAVTDWYAASVAEGNEFADYQGLGYRQILHMTHAEVISEGFSQNGQKKLILFDYNKRSLLTGNALVREAEGFVLPDNRKESSRQKGERSS